MKAVSKAEAWPSSQAVHAAVAGRITRLLDETGGLVAEIARQTLAVDSGVLSAAPHSLTSVLVAGACLSAGADWRAALWPTAAAECMMAAADLLDDVADADASAALCEPPEVLLTAAAGLLALAGTAIVRVVEDGATATTAVALADLFGVAFAEAANGQAANLQPGQTRPDALTAARQAAAKSGPLGSLMARLGARTATADVEIVELFGRFGRHLGVRSQLLNDARDAGPDAARSKADIRVGARTVPLAFAGSAGAPAGLDAAQLDVWEAGERTRIAAAGGLVAAWALAEAERLGAIHALDALEHLSCRVAGLRKLVE